jgi:hypothetical protein
MTRKHLILTGALSLAVMGVSLPALGQVGTQREDVGVKSLDWNDIPAAARQTLRREQGNDKIEKLVEIEHEGRRSYRATFVDNRGGGARTVRVSRDGEVINEVERTPVKGLARDDVDGRVIQWDDIPDAARRALKREQNNDRLEKLIVVNHDGRETYRATFSDRNGNRIVRVNRQGELISETDKPDRDGGGNNDRFAVSRAREKVAGLPGPVRQAILRETGNKPIDEVTRVGNAGRIWYIVDMDNGRRFRVDSRGEIIDNEPKLLSNFRNDDDRRRGFSRDLDDFGRGRVLSFDDLPGPVRQAIGQRTRQGDKVNDVVQVRRDGRTEYMAYVENDNFTRVYRVDERGEFLGAWNATEEGAVRVDVNDLPGPVKETLAKHAPLREYRRILQVTDNGRTEYYAYHSDKGDMHVRRVARNGELISERDADRR